MSVKKKIENILLEINLVKILLHNACLWLVNIRLRKLDNLPLTAMKSNLYGIHFGELKHN